MVLFRRKKEDHPTLTSSIDRMILLVPLVALVGHPTDPDTLVQRRAGKVARTAVWLVPMVVRWPLPDPEGAP